MNNALEWAAHALYFYNYQELATKAYKLISAPMFDLDAKNGAVVNWRRLNIMKMADELFQQAPRLGQNQEVFWYQLTP